MNESPCAAPPQPAGRKRTKTNSLPLVGGGGGSFKYAIWVYINAQGEVI